MRVYLSLQILQLGILQVRLHHYLFLPHRVHYILCHYYRKEYVYQSDRQNDGHGDGGQRPQRCSESCVFLCILPELLIIQTVYICIYISVYLLRSFISCIVFLDDPAALCLYRLLGNRQICVGKALYILKDRGIVPSLSLKHQVREIIPVLLGSVEILLH